MTHETWTELLRLWNNLENSADDTGCTADLTVVEKHTVEALAEFFGTYEPTFIVERKWEETHGN